MSESSPCTRRTGTCCSRCTAPAVTTELVDGTPWEAEFVWNSGVTGGFGGSGTTASDPFVYVFTVTPGSSLPYYRVSFDNGGFDWDPNAAVITDEDGVVVNPNTVWDEPQQFTLTVDPAHMQTPGQYDGGIGIAEYPSSPSAPLDEEDLELIGGSWEIEEDCGEMSRIVHARSDDFVITILPYHDDIVYAQFPLVQIGPTEDCDGVAQEAEWSIDITITLAGGASYTLTRNSTTITETTTYGPESTRFWFWIQMALTHAGLVDGEDYEGTMVVTSEGTTSTRNIKIQVRTSGGAAPGHSFQITDPGAVSRGVAFDLEVTAIDNETGVVDTDYDGGELRLNLTSMYSPGDDPDPGTFDSEGQWVDGVLTIPNFSFDGGAGGWPFLQVYDTSNGVYGVRQLNGNTLNVSAPAEVVRGVAFDITVQGSDPAYVPANPLTVTWTLSDGGDSGLPATISTAGWVGGAKTVSCTINGGSGTDTFDVEVTDTDLGRSASDNGDVDDAVPGACPGSPPLDADYDFDCDGEVHIWLGHFHLWGSGPYNLPDPGAFGCNWYDSSCGGYFYAYAGIVLDTVNGYWELTLKWNGGGGYVTYITARKYGGATPVGPYTITYRNTSGCSNSISNITVS